MKINRFLNLTLSLVVMIGLFAFTSSDKHTEESKLLAAPCQIVMTHSASQFDGISLNSRTVRLSENVSTVTKGCPCNGYIQLYTAGPVSWQLINNQQNTQNYGGVVLTRNLSGVLDLDNYSFTATPL